MLKRGVYAASLSVLNKDLTLNVEATISHAENLIKNGLHGCFFFGSTGMSQLISKNEKMELISKISTHKQRKHFYLGTGCNSLNENIELIKYASEFNFNTILLMPSAYYVGNSDEGVFEFYKKIILACPKIKIVIYNFQKLSGYIFSIDAITKLVKSFPKNIIGVKDSSYNLYENLKIKNFLIFPGSEAKLLKGLEKGSSGVISAVTNSTHFLARKVFDDFENKMPQTKNDQLIGVRETFDGYNLISALHSFHSIKDENYKNILPPLTLLSEQKLKELIEKLNKLKFISEKNLAA
jgi:4-hydroxy-tetrahydrodipicolinate synthase|tara:strand:- start:298 stop:1182 length:885 start_codon:yes stop_codon:yes gene_type:complete